MTSSKIYKFPAKKSTQGKAAMGAEDQDQDRCPRCQGAMTLRQQYPFPVVSQILFGLSFIGFMLTYEKVQGEKQLLWAWSGVQILLGIWLIRGRLRARRRVYRCVRCSSDLP